ncbi:MAG: NAD(P)-dependent dehydrogenase, short-chain alcohol dehydrogenase family [Hydrocarboniphaga sp.]|uniref:SDR family NAD(P)-dependent oxidoreductase n=1 Tax=Hydrocarboniphaga sp. TaxID=2033016 RepID=UPI002629046E|nr:SDR family oxidoreductase [Hydrocarboniphaga sp.]MDB5968168.1 NAD(P)-dependent dehydrogenase, short-chain alcohol dehydrogenase family [Hydrocarboniphaga sp.]
MAEQKTVLVTGGGGDIGRVTAGMFAAAGYRVAVSDVREAAAADTVEAIRRDGGRADVYEANIADPEGVKSLFERIETDYGYLDAAFNNAGRGGGGVPLLEADDDIWHDCLLINLTGTYYCMKHELRMMLKRGGGAIVNNSSLWGLHGGPTAAYTASKHGVIGLTKHAAVTYACQGMRINAICPGIITAGLGLKVLCRPADVVETMLAKVPAKRAGTADEVAAAAVWLCSDAASYMNGHMMAIDGGCGSV